MIAAPGSSALGDTTALTAGTAWALPGSCPRTSGSSPLLTAMEEDIALRRSCLSAPGSPSRSRGPPRRWDSPLGVAASTKRSCLSVTLRQAGGGLRWERPRGPAPVTPIPPRPRPVVAEGPQRRSSSDGAQATPVVKMGVSCTPPRSGGSARTGWDGLGRERDAPRGPLAMTWSPALGQDASGEAGDEREDGGFLPLEGFPLDPHQNHGWATAGGRAARIFVSLAFSRETGNCGQHVRFSGCQNACLSACRKPACPLLSLAGGNC